MGMKTFAVRLAPEGIAVFEVRPGIIRTDMTAAVAGRYDRRSPTAWCRRGRWGEAADVGLDRRGARRRAVRFATGSVIAADGGLSIPRL